MINFFILNRTSKRNQLRYIPNNKRILLPYILKLPTGEFTLFKEISLNRGIIFNKSFSFLVENSYL